MCCQYSQQNRREEEEEKEEEEGLGGEEVRPTVTPTAWKRSSFACYSTTLIGRARCSSSSQVS